MSEYRHFLYMRLLPVVLGLALMVPHSAAHEHSELCRNGIFASPADLQRLKSEAEKSRRESLSNRVRAHFRVLPQPYRGKSAQAFMKDGRSNMFAAMELALYSSISDRPDARAAGEKAAHILVSWAKETTIDGKLTVLVPRESLEKKTDYAGLGLFVSLMAMATAHVYQFVSCQALLNADEDKVVRAWLSAMAGAIRTGHARWKESNYFGRQIGNNHLSFYNASLFAIGAALDDTRLRDYAISSPENQDNFRAMLGRAIFDGREEVTDSHEKPGSVPHRGEIYDRYRMVQNNNGLYYAFFHLLALTVLAEAASNQGIDLYSMKAEGGELLLDPLLYYGEFLARTRCSRDAAPLVASGPPGYEYYKGAKVEAHFWKWIEPLIERYHDHPDAKSLAKRVRATACSEAPPPFLPIPTLFLRR